jgi:hypothetical protein
MASRAKPGGKAGDDIMMEMINRMIDQKNIWGAD